MAHKSLKKCRGIIVWDFDGVLFDVEEFKRGSMEIFEKHGVPSQTFLGAIQRMREKGANFSTALALRIMREMGARVPERKIRSGIHEHLRKTKYFRPDVDKILHRLRRAGFLHMILSFGAASYQHKKISVGCGERFKKHFIKILTTRRHKFLSLKRIARRHAPLPIFFIDDTKKHIDLVKENLPGVKTIFYGKGKSLKDVERLILKHVK